MFEKYLQEIGLNEKEAKVYLALLEVTDASVIDISKKTKINRTTVYNVVESLEEKGLVSETTLDKKTHYQAESPERLKTYVENEKQLYEEKARKVDDVIKELKPMKNESGPKPVVRFFEGKKGVINAMDQFFSAKTDGSPLYIVYPKDTLDEIFDEKEQKHYRNIRLQKNIKSKAIYTWKEGHKESDNTGDRLHVDSEQYPISCDISAYQDTVRISILGEDKLSAVLIKSKEFSNTFKSLFNLAFDKQHKQKK